MTPSIFWRLVWKEYRVQRPFWVAMVALVLAAQSILLAGLSSGLVTGTDVLFWVALAMGAFYALGAGATLFATEHEAATYPFQRLLPVSALRLFAAKVAFALASTAALFAVVWLAAAVLAGWRLPERQDHLALWGLWGMAALEMLAWGVLFSLVSTRPLVAVILAVSCASLTVELLRGGHLGLWRIEDYVAALPMRAVVVAMIALVDVWLGARWLRDPRPRPCRPGKLSLPALPEHAEAAVWVEASPWAVFGRLCWQHAAQSAPMLLVFVALVTPMALARLMARVDPGFVGQLFQSVWWVSLCCVGPALLTPPLMGACVFLADQSHRSFRFLGERGVDPRQVWLSRQLVWGLPLAVGAATLLLPAHAQDNLPALELAGYTIVAYGCGQFFSMFAHSGVLAAAFAIGLTVLVCLWAALMRMLELSWWWSVVPIPLGLLAATRLRAGDWLVERSGPKPALCSCGPAVTLAAAILLAVPLVRVYEVPYVDPGFSPADYARPRTADEEATLVLYRRAVDLMKTSDGVPRCLESPAPTREPLTAQETAWLEANEPALAMLLEAGQQTACDFFDPTWADTLPKHVVRLARWLVPSARRLEAQGQLDAALDRYLAALAVAGHLRHRINWPIHGDALELQVYRNLPYWAGQRGQSSDRVLNAMHRLERAMAQMPSRSDPVKSHYLLYERCLHADPSALACVVRDQRELLLTRLAVRCLFWEQARALRVLNLWSADTLATCARAEAAASAGQPIALGSVPPPADEWWHRAAKTTPLGPAESVTVTLHDGLGQIETHRRAARVLLALAAWKIDRGSLPDSIEELQGKYVSRVPLEPLAGRPFHYYPKGVPCPFRDQQGCAVEAETPFLWSAQVPVRHNGHGPAGPSRAVGQCPAVAPASPEEVLRLGLAFLIP